MSAAGQRVLQGLEEALRFARGEAGDARVWQAPILDVAELRKKAGLSQEEFARRYKINLATLRNWEQKVRSPEGPARVLLMVIAAEPEAVERAIEAWRPKQVAPKSAAPKKRPRAQAATKRTPRKRKRA